jgi:hypothetical protein
MEEVWKNLPYDLVRQVLAFVKDIDVRIAFNILPEKLEQKRIWRIDYLLNSHDGIIYNLESKSLHVFNQGYHMIKRPLEFNNFTNVFNENCEDYMMEITSPNGVYINFPHHGEPVHTNLRVLLRGSSLI